MSNSNVVTNRTPSSLQEKLTARRVSVNSEGEKTYPSFNNTGNTMNNTPVDNEVSESNDIDFKTPFSEIAELTKKFSSNDSLIKPSGDILSMVGRIRGSGVYRNGDIIIISQGFGYVISHPKGEFVVNERESLLSVAISVMIETGDENLLSQIGETLECITYEFNESQLDMINGFQPNMQQRTMAMHQR